MSADLVEYTLEEIASDQRNALVGGSFGSNLVSKDYVDSGVPVIRGQNMGDGRWVSGRFAYVSEDKAKKLLANTARPGDLLFTQRGTLGQVAIVPNDAYSRYIVSQSQMKVTVNEKMADVLFLYYYFISPEQIEYVKKNAIQTGVPHINLGILKRVPVKLPCLQSQKNVAGFLDSLDRKVEVNFKVNRTLENMAQAIFKSWFVDFEPVKAKMAALEAGGSEEDVLLAAMQAISGKNAEQLEKLKSESSERYAELEATAELFPAAMQESELGGIPVGWQVSPFSEVARLVTRSVKPSDDLEKVWEHFSIPAFDEHKVPALELGKDIKSNKYRVDPESVLVSKLNPHFPRIWWPQPVEHEAAICSTEFMQFVPRSPVLRPFVAGMITSQTFQQGIMMRVTGSTGSRQRAQPKQVATMDVVLPPESLMLVYSRRTVSMYAAQASNIKQSQTLVQLRDTLLPKLLSGELTLPEAEERVAEVADA